MNEVVNDVPVTEEPTPAEVVIEAAPVKPGEKTDSAALLKSLQEEREKRRLLEAELATRTPEGDVFSDEGKTILQKVDALKEELALRDVYAANPAIKDKAAEFDEFRTDPDNAGMNLRTAAKAFLIEKDLVETPARKGLEKAQGGGQRAPVQTGLTAEQVTDLRNNNYRKYSAMVRNGEIKVN